MKQPLFLFALLALPLPAFSQQLYPLQEAHDSLQIRVVVREGRAALEWSREAALFQSRKGFPRIVDVRIEDADLVVLYEPVRVKGNQSYLIDLAIQAEGGERFVPAPYSIRDAEPVSGQPEQRRVTWMDAAEERLSFGPMYTLYVHRSLMGAVQCEGVRPAFTLAKQLPHYLVGAIGFTALGFGELYRQQAKGAYDNYQKFWTEGSPRTDAQPFLDDAQKRNKSAKICTAAGLILLGADAAWYLKRRASIRRKQTTYDQFCVGGKTSFRMTLQPAFLASSGSLGGSPGVSFSLRF